MQIAEIQSPFYEQPEDLVQEKSFAYIYREHIIPNCCEITESKICCIG
jgi:hypothetical protein